MDIKYWKKSEGYIIRSIDDWSSGENLLPGDIRLNPEGYFCIVGHLSAAANEPGVGANWEDYWLYFSQGAQGLPGGAMAWKGAYSAGTTYAANDGVLSSEGRAFYALQETTGNAPPSYPDTTNTYWSLFAERGTSGIQADGSVAMTGALTMAQIATPSEPAASKTSIYAKSDGKVYKFANGGEETEIGSGAGFWSNVPGTPTRIGDTSFSITDASNANLYDKAFGPGTVLRWEKSGGGAQFAKVTAASYGANAVTLTIVGNTLSAGFSSMKYCIHRAEQEVFIVPGTLPGNTATTDIAKTIHVRGDIYVFSAKIWYKTGPTTTNGVWDVNDDGSTIFTTKPEVAASATEGVEQVSDCLAGTATTAVADKSLITVDYDSGHATTPGADAYIYLFWMPVAWRYLS